MTIVFPMRLNKYLALSLGISRREADELIEHGRVTVAGTKAVVGGQVEQGSAVVVDGIPVDTDTKMIYLALHKPIDYVCSRRQQGDIPTIYELLPDNYQNLKTVGRLDRNSSGIILLTNDGDFAQRMTHPSYQKVKIYNISLDRPLEPLHQQMINDIGVNLEDGKSQLTLEKQTDDRLNWIVTMSEGRNRQIRRTFGALGYIVVSLHRTDFGPYHLGDLKQGEFAVVEMLQN